MAHERRSPYYDLISTMLHERGIDVDTVDPVAIECSMRVTYGTLDHLSRAHFDAEVGQAVETLRHLGAAGTRRLVESYGFEAQP